MKFSNLLMVCSFQSLAASALAALAPVDDARFENLIANDHADGHQPIGRLGTLLFSTSSIAGGALPPDIPTAANDMMIGDNALGDRHDSTNVVIGAFGRRRSNLDNVMTGMIRGGALADLQTTGARARNTEPIAA